MGSHQMMLVVLVVVLIGVATALGIFLFRMHAVNTNRQLMINDMNFLGAEALRFWRTPENMGGCSGNLTSADQDKLEFFLHWSGNTNSTASGTYTIQAFDDGSLEIIGLGTELGEDNVTPVKAVMKVKPDSLQVLSTVILN